MLFDTSIHAIAAIGPKRELGLNGGLPWRFPEDTKFFRETVKGKTILLGRKTWQSMPASTLKESECIVFSKTLPDDAADHIVRSLTEALQKIMQLKRPQIFVCGGESIYKELLPLTDILHLSHIPYSGEADSYFPKYEKQIEEILKEEARFDKEASAAFIYREYLMLGGR